MIVTGGEIEAIKAVVYEDEVNNMLVLPISLTGQNLESAPSLSTAGDPEQSKSQVFGICPLPTNLTLEDM